MSRWRSSHGAASRRQRGARLIACVVAAASTACEAADDAASRSSESAGPVEWILQTPAEVEIGVVDGDERYELVSVFSGFVDTDGRIILLDDGRPALLFYDSAGGFISRTGGRGAGPGEFQAPSHVWRYRGDSIATYDFGQQRVTVFAADGSFGRSFNNPMRFERKPGTAPSNSCCAIGGAFADGSFLGHPPDDIPTEPGPPRNATLTPVRIHADGSGVDTIGRFESALFRTDASTRMGVSGYVTSYYFRYALLSDRVIGGNGLFDGLIAAIVSGPPEGLAASTTVALDTLPLPGEPRPFTPELQDEYDAALRAAYELRDGRSEGQREPLTPDEFPPIAPRFVNVRGDDDDRVWLERWTPPQYGRLSARVVYDVLERTGRHVASIELPPSSRLLWSRGDRVMVVERDSLDVQYVRVYRMRVREAEPEAGQDRGRL